MKASKGLAGTSPTHLLIELAKERVANSINQRADMLYASVVLKLR